MARVKLIGKSKRRRGLGVIERQGQDIKALQRAPQAGVLTVHKHILGGGGGGGGGGDGVRTATLVVAANDATAAEKAGADYTCDGTADDVQINAALAALPDTGGSVVLSSGTFNIASPILGQTDNITIKGQGAGQKAGATQTGAGTKLLYAAGLTGQMFLVQRAANDRPVYGAMLCDFVVDGNASGTTLDGIVFRSNRGLIDHVHVHRMTRHGIVVRGYGYESGTAEAADATSITDTDKEWRVDHMIGWVVTCDGKTMTITGNTPTVATGTGWSGGGAPTPGAYTIPSDSNTVGWDTYDTILNLPICGDNAGAGVYFDHDSTDSHLVNPVLFNNQDSVYFAAGSMQIQGGHYYNPSRHNFFFDGAGSRTKMTGGKVEGSGQHGVNIDSTKGGTSDLQVTGVGFANNGDSANNTYDQIIEQGPSGNAIARSSYVGCHFSNKGGNTNLARYGINLSGSASQATLIGDCIFGPDSHFGTDQVNNNSSTTTPALIRDCINTPDDPVDPLDSPIYGDGSDGDVTISANTTLTRDMYYNTLTVNSGIVLSTGGFRIFCKGETHITGSIRNQGGAGASAGTAGTAAPAGTVGGGTAGGAGNIGAGSNGTDQTDPSGGGDGGAGGSGAGGAGGTGGTTPYTDAHGGFRDLHACLTGMTQNNEVLTGGAGGGGGAGTGGATPGGGGGGGGGIIVLCTKTLHMSGASSTIRARGGIGATVTGGSTAKGGGGGGGGGVAFIVYGQVTYTDTTSAAIDANGGVGGTGANGGGNGVNGSTGVVIMLLHESAGSSSGGGVNDHGLLTGLADDDHPQYTTDAEADAIADGLIATHAAIANAHHDAVTIGADGEHSLATQVLSGVDAASGQKGHIQLAGDLGGTAAAPNVKGITETSGPTKLTIGAIADGEYTRRVGVTLVGGTPAGGGGAPTDADYLVGTANAGLSAEIVVGATPGGELGGTWASPTVDATHSGSAHADYVAKSLFDAQTVLAATADNTPAAVTVAEQRIVGRKTGGNITALTAAEVITMLATVYMITGTIYAVPESTTVPKLIVGPMPFAGTFVKLTIKSYAVAAESAIRVDLHKQTAANENTNTSTTVFTTQTNRPTIAAASYAGSTTTFEVATFAKGDWLYFFVDVDDSGITVLRFGLEVTPT